MYLTICLFLLLNPNFYADESPLAAGRAALADGQKQLAKERFEAALTHPEEKLEALIELTALLTTPADYKQAVAYGKQAIAAGPDNARAHYRYALAEVAKLQYGNMFAGYAAAETYKREIRRAIELDPKLLEARTHEIYFYLNAADGLGGSPARALELAVAMTDVDRNRGLLEQVKALRKLERYEEALALGVEALRSQPNEPELILMLAFLHYEKKDYKAAIAVLATEVPSDAPVFGSILYQRARSRIMAEVELDQAVEMLQRFIVLRPSIGNDGLPDNDLPSVSSAYWRLGQIYEKQGKLDLARSAYTKGAAESNPDSHNQERLKALGKP